MLTLFNSYVIFPPPLSRAVWCFFVINSAVKCDSGFQRPQMTKADYIPIFNRILYTATGVINTEIVI